MWHAAAAVLALATLLTAVETFATLPARRFGTMVSGAFPAVGAVVAWRFGPRLSARRSYVVGRAFLLLAIASTALSIHNWAGTIVAGAEAFNFVLVVVFAAAYFGRRDVVELIVVIALVQTATLATDGVEMADVLTLLLTMLAVAGSGLVLSSAVQAMDALSYRDALTGAANRRAWDLGVDDVLAVPLRSPVSVLLVDVDHFKAINDRSGHDGGDAVLRAAVTVWRQVTRTSDTLARLGGDEFGLLLVDCDLVEATAVAEQLLRDLRERVGATCSIGVATVVPDGERSLLLATADAQLYQAKRDGRACVRGTFVGAAQHPGERLSAAAGGVSLVRPRRAGSSSARPGDGAR